MQILGYGEDALTLWALQNKLPVILESLNDSSIPPNCKAFFRPSFGRSGGEHSAQFGEFDFILLAETCVYLGESKWDRSSEKIVEGVLTLRDEQLLRHASFEFYLQEWAWGQYASWHDFVEQAPRKLQERGITKPIAPEFSLLASNLQAALTIIQQHFTTRPTVRNVLLYFHSGQNERSLPSKAGNGFAVVTLNYSAALRDNFINLGG